MVLGMFAIIEPAVAALAVSRLVAWLLVFAGLVYLIGAGTGRGVKEVILPLAIGIMYLVGGRYFLMHPHLAMGTLTLLLGTVIMAGGVTEIVSYLVLHRGNRSGWVLFNGIVAFLLGGMIWFHYPVSSLLGRWNSSWNRTPDDRNDAPDARSQSAKASQVDGEVGYELQF
jgi:uncharacterized membrane protein HdeD (DUF308 family)